MKANVIFLNYILFLNCPWCVRRQCAGSRPLPQSFQITTNWIKSEMRTNIQEWGLNLAMLLAAVFPQTAQKTRQRNEAALPEKQKHCSGFYFERAGPLVHISSLCGVELQEGRKMTDKFSSTFQKLSVGMLRQNKVNVLKLTWDFCIFK